MIGRLIIILVALLAAMTATATTIAGRVLDENQKCLAYANVVLLNRVDSTFIQGTVTDDNGIFTITIDSDGGILKISSVGYAARYIDARPGNVGDIVIVNMPLSSVTVP